MSIKIKTLLILLVLSIGLVMSSCQKKETPDTEKPTIDMEYAEFFPSYCDTIYFGEAFNLKASFSDNVELGAFSIDIHNNFDHHIHAYKIELCPLEPVKSPTNPYVLLDDFEIPIHSTQYQTNTSVTLPTENDKGRFDEGDYCLHIYLTDKEGWSTPSAVSIKILHRDN